ncbi:MAG: hypothetical protein HUU12_08785, partial [Anaerolineales bacterium]|nr:hypothetical protein [Anaerolineales bacterium]
MRRFIVWMFAPLLFLTSILVPSERVASRSGLFSPNPSASQFIERVNALRNSQGLKPYAQNAILM